MGDIADLVDSAWILTARNGANGKMTARICASADSKRRGMGQQNCCPVIKLSNGDRVTRGTRRTFEAQRCKTEGEFVDFRRR